MGLNGFVGPISGPGFQQDGQKGVLQDSLGLKSTYVQIQMLLQQIYHQYEPDGPRDLCLTGMITQQLFCALSQDWKKLFLTLKP